MVLHNLRQGDQTLLKNMGIRHRNVANVPRGKRGSLRRVLRIDLIRGRRDLYLLVNLVLVIQDQGELVGPGVEGDHLAGKHEEAFLANFRVVVPGGKIVESEMPCSVRLRSIGVPSGILKLDLCCSDRDGIFVQHRTRAIGGVRRLHSPRSKNGGRKQYRSKQASRPHATPSQLPHLRLNYSFCQLVSNSSADVRTAFWSNVQLRRDLSQ